MDNDRICPSIERLIAFRSGDGGEEFLSSVSNHIQHCEQCRLILTELEIETSIERDNGDPQTASVSTDLLRETVPFDSRLPDAHTETRVFRGFDQPPFEGDSQTEIGHRFEILGKIGRGGFASVWKARDHRLKRVVALKQSHPRMFSEYSEQLYLREAQAIAQLHHPGIVAVYDILKQPQSLILICQYIEGQNLSDYLKDHALSQKQAARFCLQIAEALSHAAERSIIHRDLKPANILVDGEGNPHVADFGLARNLSETCDNSDMVGTPAYMSPEQIRGENDQVDGRTDVYALGCILAEMLTGERPFVGGMQDIQAGGVGRKITSPRERNPQIAKDLDAICLKALTESPGDRYQSADAMALDLQRYLEHRPVQCRPQTWTRTAWLAVRRNPVWAALPLLLCAFLAVAWNFPAGDAGIEMVEVLIDSDPPGAEITFIPLDEKTGLPKPEDAVKTTATMHDNDPCQTTIVPPGRYLVVAVNSETFHEVFRTVPSATDLTPKSPYSHRAWWRLEDGRIELNYILMNFDHTALTKNMAKFGGAKRFQVGDPTLDQNPPMDVVIQPYWLDGHEVTIGEFYANLPPEAKTTVPEPSAEEALLPKTSFSWEEAVHYCERIGKRLPDEWEFEFAASLGGTRAFPWGDAPRKESPWEIGPVAGDKQDRLPTNPPVYGLYSNALEWTSSMLLANRTLMNRLALINVPPDDRVVKGGPQPILNDGNLPDPPPVLSIRQRYPRERRGGFPDVGFRCARSVKPRLKPEDFSRILVE